jgi:glycerol kinase
VSFILALDQGTTGSAALVLDESGAVRGHADREIAQHYPASGHVEHDPEEIFATTVAVGREALAAAKATAREVAAIGITCQRETTVVWERATGRPIHSAVVWQSRASAAICDQLKSRGLEPLVRRRTGLVIDAYFSATKVRWILDRVSGAQARAEAGELLFGTVDSWLVWKLTGGRAHVTDVSNASRTLVFDIHRGAWDDDLLGAPDPAGHAAGAGAFERGGRGVRCGAFRRGDPGRRDRGRPAGGAVRPDLLQGGRGEEHVRHGVLPAGQYG